MMMTEISLPWTDPGASLGSSVLLGLLPLLVLTLLQVILLPPPRWRWLAAPLTLAVLYLLFMGLKWLSAGETNLSRAFGTAALFVLLLGLCRCAFTLIFHGLLHVLHRDLPKIFLDVLQFFVYMAAVVFTLSAAGVEFVPLLTGSAVLTVVLGLAMKDTLGNLISGIALQAQQPFEPGDWIQFDTDPAHVGRVVELNWRATTVVTLDEVAVVVPNGMLNQVLITNFTKPLPLARRSVYVHAPIDVPPKQVHALILAAVGDAWGVLADPAPSVVTLDYDERGVRYWVRFFTTEFARRDRVDGGVRDCAWYALRRAGIDVPGPRRAVTFHRPTAPVAPGLGGGHDLRTLPLFADLPDDAARRLAPHARVRLFAPQEVIVREGTDGDELFVLLRGRVTVTKKHDDGRRIALAELGPGDYFGEHALLSGGQRSATVQAADECELLVLEAVAVRKLLEDVPDLAERVRRTAGERKSQRDGRLALEADETPEPPSVWPFLFRFLEQRREQ
jgi:small-conductance mechanosensitive channel